MTLHEPATLITDYLLALVALVLGLRLRRPPPPPARRWFARALILSALSAFVGGSYHGLGPNFSAEVASLWWRLTLVILSFVSAALALSLMHGAAPPHRHLLIRSIIVLKLVIFVVIALLKPLFLVAIADYGTALLAWLAVALASHRPWRAWMLAAIGLSAVAAAVQQLRVSPSPHFNHNDLYHVIQGFAFAAFYRAGRLLGRADV
jgi:hypothetical protein